MAGCTHLRQNYRSLWLNRGSCHRGNSVTNYNKTPTTMTLTTRAAFHTPDVVLGTLYGEGLAFGAGQLGSKLPTSMFTGKAANFLGPQFLLPGMEIIKSPL